MRNRKNLMLIILFIALNWIIRCIGNWINNGVLKFIFTEIKGCHATTIMHNNNNNMVYSKKYIIAVNEQVGIFLLAGSNVEETCTGRPFPAFMY